MSEIGYDGLTSLLDLLVSERNLPTAEEKQAVIYPAAGDGWEDETTIR